MRVLLLFFTQAEAGAPGYLSRRGEDSAANLADTLGEFLSGTLEVKLMEEFEARAKSLNEDLRWKAYRKQESLGQAISASLKLFPEILLMSGAQIPTLKTSEALATQFGFPICVDERLDRSSADKPSRGVLNDALEELLNSWLMSESQPPKAVIVGTSGAALLEWFSHHMDTEKLASMKEVFANVTEQGVLPTVFACGSEHRSDGTIAWFFD